MAETGPHVDEVVRSPATLAEEIHVEPESPCGSDSSDTGSSSDADGSVQLVQFQSGSNIPYPRNLPVSSATTITIHRVPEPLRKIDPGFAAPIAVAIGPYHHGSPHLHEMEAAKIVARDEFCDAARRSPEAIRQNIASVAAEARGCYNDVPMDDDGLTEIMFTDGCFLMRFMVCMCGGGDAPAADRLWAKVHAHVDAIARDLMLLENQLPWLVIKKLMENAPPTGSSWLAVQDSFLDLMASAFNVGNDVAATATQQQRRPPYPPPHLLSLFHRRQVGEERTQRLHVPSLFSLSSTAMELAEMGVKLTATKKGKIFGDMTMTKRRPCLGIYGELALAPVVLNELTECWLFNMVAHEACLGATYADNFAVSSYVSVVSMLMNRIEDVQELRGKGIVVSAFSDEMTLCSFKALARRSRLGYRYYDVFRCLQEYRQERWLWIAVHGFLYRNIKTIIAVFSAIGVLAGLFKAILSLKHPPQG